MNENKNIIKYSYPYITENKKCDVLVVGAGISGAITAYFLAKKGYKVIIAEQNIAGFHGTNTSNGVVISKANNIQDENKHINYDRLNKLYEAAFNDIFNINEEIKNFIASSHIEDILKDALDVKFELCNYIEATSKYAKRHVLQKNAQETNKEDISLFDMCAANVYENKATVIFPYVFTTYLLLMLSNMENVEIFENTRIVNVVSENDETHATTQNDFKITANTTIYTTGIDFLNNIDENEISLNIYLAKTNTIICKLKSTYENLVLKDIATNLLFCVKFDNMAVTSNIEKINEKLENSKELIAIKKLYLQAKQALKIDTELKVKSYYTTYELITKDMLGIVDEIPNLPNVYCNIGVGENSIIQSIVGAKILQDIPQGFYDKSMSMFRLNR